MHELLGRRALIWLTIAVALTGLSSAAVVFGLRLAGDSSEAAIELVGSLRGSWLTGQVHEDSWEPMLAAYQRKDRDPHADLYRLFFEDHVKFQYPPSSLLVLDLAPASVTDYVPPAPEVLLSTLLQLFMTWPSRLVYLLAILSSAAIVEVSLRKLAPAAPYAARPAIARVIACLALGLTFYPLLKSYELGQIQVFLNGLVALALLLRLLGKPALCGILLSLCCMVKPQYGVVLLFALLRRQWRFALGFGVSFALGTAISVLRFGVHDHARYLQVLQTIGRLGEVYWPNQSVNGLLNRFLGNGDPVVFTEHAFAPYRSGVYLASLISAVALLGLALWPRRTRVDSTARDYESALALALVIAAATAGSPVAWEHHYGTFLAIFALALPGLIAYRPLGRLTAPLFALSYLAMANALLRPELLFSNRWLGLVGSHLFIGSLILFALTYLLARRQLPRSAAAAWTGADSTRNNVHSDARETTVAVTCAPANQASSTGPRTSR